MERNSILDEDDRETNPLIQNPAPPPPPPLPKARPPPAAVPPGAPTPARTQQIRQRQQATPRPNPLIPRKIAASSAPPPLPPPDGPPPPPPPAVCSADWVLRIKHRGRGILRIHVPEGMTAYLLSKCIIQATDFNDDSVVVSFSNKECTRSDVSNALCLSNYFLYYFSTGTFWVQNWHFLLVRALAEL